MTERGECSQYIHFDENGKLIQFNCTLFKGLQEGVSVYTQIPFFSSIKVSVTGLEENEEIIYPLVNLDFFGVSGYFDFHFTNVGGHYYCSVYEVKFSKVLKNAIYDRNTSLIQEEFKKHSA